MSAEYTKGLHEIGDGLFAWLQPDGSWGWSNAGLVTGGDTALLVDTPFDLRLTSDMLGEMRRRVPAAARIGTVVNTHANGDHCFGNELVNGAEIVASAPAAKEMAELPPSRLAELVAAAPTLGPLGKYIDEIFGPFEFGDITLTLPTRTFEGALNLHVGDREVRLTDVGPAHTAGDVLVEIPDARAVFTGDILFHGGHPIVWSGPVANWIAACDRILAMDVDTVVPGHGPLADKAAVADLRRYFEDLTREARTRFDAGMSPLGAARDIRLDVADGWGESERVVVNITTLYRDFGGEPPADIATLFGHMAELAGFK